MEVGSLYIHKKGNSPLLRRERSISSYFVEEISFASQILETFWWKQLEGWQISFVGERRCGCTPLGSSTPRTVSVALQTAAAVDTALPLLLVKSTHTFRRMHVKMQEYVDTHATQAAQWGF